MNTIPLLLILLPLCVYGQFTIVNATCTNFYGGLANCSFWLGWSGQPVADSFKGPRVNFGGKVYGSLTTNTMSTNGKLAVVVGIPGLALDAEVYHTFSTGDCRTNTSSPILVNASNVGLASFVGWYNYNGSETFNVPYTKCTPWAASPTTNSGNTAPWPVSLCLGNFLRSGFGLNGTNNTGTVYRNSISYKQYDPCVTVSQMTYCASNSSIFSTVVGDYSFDIVRFWYKNVTGTYLAQDLSLDNLILDGLSVLNGSMYYQTTDFASFQYVAVTGQGTWTQLMNGQTCPASTPTRYTKYCESIGSHCNWGTGQTTVTANEYLTEGKMIASPFTELNGRLIYYSDSQNVEYMVRFDDAYGLIDTKPVLVAITSTVSAVIAEYENQGSEGPYDIIVNFESGSSQAITESFLNGLGSIRLGLNNINSVCIDDNCLFVPDLASTPIESSDGTRLFVEVAAILIIFSTLYFFTL